MSARRATGWEDELPRIIARHPGSTCRQITELATTGRDVVGNRLYILTKRGMIQREGRGGPEDPFRYYPASKP